MSSVMVGGTRFTVELAPRDFHARKIDGTIKVSGIDRSRGVIRTVCGRSIDFGNADRDFTLAAKFSGGKPLSGSVRELVRAGLL